MRIALDWLLEVEFPMGEIFKAVAASGDMQVIEDAFHYLYELYMTNGQKPIPDYELQRFLQERTPSYNVVNIINSMLGSRMIKKTFTSVGKCYTPLSKRPQ